ncbi:MAG: UDP-3-O-[3-hydroxymyristoyl] glucosamine N-acyltransferase [Myxococcota bacterium]|jgi:UDP-3-O-[3-hydroxymyristoyl] glucosamine N-acyltransferase
MPYSRILLFAPLLATATVAFAADLNGDDCEDAQFALNGACIHETAVVDDTVTTTSDTHVYDYASIGPFVDLGDVFVGNGAIIHGWESHLTKPLTIGDLSTIGSRAEIGADCIIGQNVPVGRVAQIGANCTLGDDTQVGRGVILESDVTTGVGVHIYTGVDLGLKVSLDDYVTVGSHTTLGDYTYMGPFATIGRNGVVTGGSSPEGGSIILARVGPTATIGAGVLIDLNTKVAKNVTIGSGAQIMDGASIRIGATVGTNATVFGTVGKRAIVEENATVHGTIGNNSTACAGDTVASGVTIKNNKTSQGDTCTSPVLVQRARPLVVGGSHACAVLPDETAVCWGYNNDGQLGNGAPMSHDRFDDNGSYISGVAGANEGLPVAVVGLTDVAGFALNTQNSCALKTDGTVWCWGSQGWDGQLGNSAGTQSDVYTAPVLGGETTPVQVTGLTDATAIAAAYHHYCAVKSDTTVVCWGAGAWGGLGVVGTTGIDKPIQVIAADGDPLSGILDIAVGSYGSCALAIDGQVFCWGNGQTLGGNAELHWRGYSNLNSFTPVKVDRLENITEISMGQARAFALEPDGTALAWGNNAFQEMGIPNTGEERSPTTAFAGAGAVAELSTNEQYSCMLLAEPSAGTVVCGGDGSSGVLGAGDERSSAETPYVFVDQTEMGPVAALSHSGAAMTQCARTPTGDVWCWGSGTSGSLGDGLFQRSDIPVQVSGLNMGPL